MRVWKMTDDYNQIYNEKDLVTQFERGQQAERKSIEGHGICPDCFHPIKIRNPTGKCDHLYYPENKVEKEVWKMNEHKHTMECIEKKKAWEKVREEVLKAWDVWIALEEWDREKLKCGCGK